MENCKCINCRKREGDCGHHLQNNTDAWTPSACDRFGNCAFYEDGRTECQKVIDSLKEHREEIGMYINVAAVEKCYQSTKNVIY